MLTCFEVSIELLSFDVVLSSKLFSVEAIFNVRPTAKTLLLSISCPIRLPSPDIKPCNSVRLIFLAGCGTT